MVVDMPRALKVRMANVLPDLFTYDENGELQPASKEVETEMTTVEEYERVFSRVSNETHKHNSCLKDIRNVIMSDEDNWEAARKSSYFSDMFDENGNVHRY